MKKKARNMWQVKKIEEMNKRKNYEGKCDKLHNNKNI